MLSSILEGPIRDRLLCLVPAICVVLLAINPMAGHAAEAIGIFQDHGDVGTVLHPGAARYDSAQKSYTISGSGENMWFGMDDFHYAWKQVSGDVALAANVVFTGSTGNNHRKAVLMIRQTLDGNARSVDVARHGDGLTSLQFRDEAGANTHEIESYVEGPARVKIVKRGDYVYAFVSGKDGKMEPAGASTRLKLTGPYYIGIGVSSHDKDVTETAVFSDVQLDTLAPARGAPTLYSTIETVTVASTDRRVAYTAPEHVEAPNWSRDGSYLLYNSDGRIHKLGLTSLAAFIMPELPASVVPIRPNVNCNNDHGLSPDGKMLAISDSTGQDGKSRVYTVPVDGGVTKQITEKSPSYWHGWSPDGKTLAYTGQRDGDFDIYTTPVEGGVETRLTTAKGLDDGPEYSPDGQYIYFSSERSGSMQIWRMKPDGSGQERVLTDETNDWFPHISPDSKSMVYLAYDKGVTGHPAEKDVQIMLVSLPEKKVSVLAKLFGGQGTINVPSWSPDSRRIAFVSYELLSEEDRSGR